MAQQREHVLPNERLPARDVEALEPQRHRPVHDAEKLLKGEPGFFARSRGHEAVRARQVAGVVDLQPQLSKPARRDERQPARVGSAPERLVGEHPRAVESPQEIVHVHPRLAGLELPLGGVAGDLRAERHGTSALDDRLQQGAARGLNRDPVRTGAVDGVCETVVLEEGEIG